MAINSQNMNLPVPVPSVTDGPEWAQNEVDCLTIIDSHTHAPGSGVPITPTGLNMNADLSFQNTSSIINLFSTVFNPSTVSTLNAVYVSGVDLYYNDGNGTVIPITSGGSVNAGAGSITGLPSGTASASFDAVDGTFIWQQSTSTGANMDGATYVLRYPGSYPTPSGNYIALQAPTSLSSGYAITFPAVATATPDSFLVMSTAGALSYKYVDNTTLDFTGNTLEVKPLGITNAYIALGTITGNRISATAGILGSQLSTSAGITGGQIANLTLVNANIAGTAGIEGEKLITNPNFNGKHPTSASKNLVISNTNATNSLAIIRGYATDGTTPSSGFVGEGVFLVRTTTGSYTLIFTTSFTDIPAVTITVVDTGATGTFTANISALSTSGVSFQIAAAGVLTNKPFTFIIVGQRA